MQRVLVFLLILWPAWASAQVAPRPAPTSRAILRAAPLPPQGTITRWRTQQRTNVASPLGMWSPPENYSPPPVRLAPPPSQSSIGRPGELPPSQRTLVQVPGRPFTTADAQALVNHFRNPTMQRPPATPTFTNVPVTSNARPLRELVSGVNPAGPDGVRPCPGGVGCRNIVVQRMQGELGHRSATATIGACRLGLGCQSSHTTVGLRAASGNARSEAQATIGPDAGYAIGHGSGSGTISGGRRALLDATVRRITEATPGVPHNVGAALRSTLQQAHGDNAPPVVQTPILQRRGHQ